jgi:hypothetical protein
MDLFQSSMHLLGIGTTGHLGPELLGKLLMHGPGACPVALSSQPRTKMEAYIRIAGPRSAIANRQLCQHRLAVLFPDVLQVCE